MTEELRDLPEGAHPDGDHGRPNEEEGAGTGRVLPPPSAPLEVAYHYLDDEHSHPDGYLLRCYQDEFWQWRGSYWAEVEENALRARLYAYTREAECQAGDHLRLWTPSPSKINGVVDALKGACHLPREIEQPVWLPGAHPYDGVIVACENGLLDVGERRLAPHSPKFFNFVAVPFSYDPDAPDPKRWLNFLESLELERDEVHLLQEWFGYVISGRTHLQKILLLIGPPRAGKGVISRVLSKLVGRQSVAGPTLHGLRNDFGMEPLIGKSLAVFADARLHGRGTDVVVERLLSISGEDTLTVNRKNRSMWTGKLTCRIVLCSNEMPQLGDASGAIATRFVMVKLHQKWLGREDLELEAELEHELPEILSWSLDGLVRLQEQGWRFTQPKAAEEAFRELLNMASPVTAFVEEKCELDPEATTPVKALWTAWKVWAEVSGVPKGSVQSLGRDLQAAFPQLRVARPRKGGVRERAYRGLHLSQPTRADD